MIGGRDILVEVPAGMAALDCALRTIRQFWPRAVFEDAVSARLFPDYETVPFGDLRELLVYRDFDSFKLWERLGADPSVDGTMVHLLAAPGELTLVVDDQPGPEILNIIESIRDALRLNLFRGKPVPEAA